VNSQGSIASSELARLVGDFLGELDEVAQRRFLSNYTDANGRVFLERDRRPRAPRPPKDQLDLF
jgi:transcriptional regulator NrdR family protein